jgi:hypothetical protein
MMVSKSFYCCVCGEVCEFKQTFRQTGRSSRNLTRCPSATEGVEARWFDSRAKAVKSFEDWCHKTYGESEPEKIKEMI